ncbi:hypothetical protein F5B20DRAFT_527764 [Whalleya microplaca]|nr:hypothetical protein F5B20DRAFT_527764 [Whalleya microplaca]
MAPPTPTLSQATTATALALSMLRPRDSDSDPNSDKDKIKAPFDDPEALYDPTPNNHAPSEDTGNGYDLSPPSTALGITGASLLALLVLGGLVWLGLRFYRRRRRGNAAARPRSALEPLMDKDADGDGDARDGSGNGAGPGPRGEGVNVV